MKNIKYFYTCVASLAAILSSCSGGGSILDDAVFDINRDAISLYSYKDSYDDFSRVDAYFAFSESHDLPSVSSSGSIVVFDCSSFPEIPTSILDKLHNWLNSDIYVWVLFCDATDLSFFSGSKFDNEKHNYDTGGWYVTAYYNNGDSSYFNSTGYTLASEKTGRDKLIENIAGFSSKVLRGVRAEQ
ncbi:MAG: hypothetical protein LKE31_01435 [Bacilli bacterium]|jgi:hypothetical protein|nr:hypothetical protein [Bacilli bacterium]